MSDYSASQKAAAALRELNWRRYVYDKRVASGAMTRGAADYGIAIMEAIEADYRRLAEAEEARQRLL